MSRLSRKEYLAQGFAMGLGALGALTLGGAATAHAAAGAVRATRPAATVGPVPTIPQTWNNCGPASIAEVLAFWGIQRTQSDVQAVLRVDGYAHGMSPYGVPAYARALGMDALVGVAGTSTLLKALVAAGFPIIVTQWVSTGDHTSHYRPITGYDDRQDGGVFVASDPYLGPRHVIGYADFAAMWAEDDYRFLVLYPPSRRTALATILAASSWNQGRAYRHDLAWVQARLFSAYPDVASWAAPVAVPGSRFLRLAWDEAQLGQAVAARRALQQATAQGAAASAVGWIAAVTGG